VEALLLCHPGLQESLQIKIHLLKTDFDRFFNASLHRSALDRAKDVLFVYFCFLEDTIAYLHDLSGELLNMLSCGRGGISGDG